VLPERIGRWHPFNRGEYVEARTLLPSYLLSSQGDRMLMANSVEGRFPFLDHRLIAFANALHPRHKMRVLREKHLLRETMKADLPPSIAQRAKQPYRAPDAAAFLQGATPDYVNQLMGRECLAKYGYFDPDKVGRLVAKLQRARVNAARDNMAFVGILSTQLWHRNFVEGHA
jgi:asparagine synthase (glutamine-hydrolysing)